MVWLRACSKDCHIDAGGRISKQERGHGMSFEAQEKKSDGLLQNR
jgi:hypothetical protein